MAVNPGLMASNAWMRSILQQSVVMFLVATLFGCDRSDSQAARQDRELPPVTNHGWDVAFPGSDQIVFAEWYGRAIRSIDGGKTWSTTEIGAPVHDVTQGPDGKLWGIYSWRGIHEPASASFAYSTDSGKTWTTYDLDPAVFLPESFISPLGTEPMVIAADGQIWRHEPGQKESRKNWVQVGTKNPEGDGWSGLVTLKGIYIGTREHIWLSRDDGKTWQGAPSDSGSLCATKTKVWALHRWGKLRVANLGENVWTEVAKIEEVESPHKLVSRDETVYASAQGGGMTAVAIRIDPDRSIHRLRGVTGKTCTSVRIGRDGRAWFVAEGLYVEGDNDNCKQVWP
jgi:hypothetical protein